VFGKRHTRRTIKPYSKNSHSKLSALLRLIPTCHAVPMPCCVNSQYYAAPLPFSDSAVFFVEGHVVVGNIQTANPSSRDWYASYKLRGTPRGTRKKPNADRSPTCRLWTADYNSHMPCPCCAHTALCRGLEKSLPERHGRGMACVNQTRPHCVNQIGKTQYKSFALRHGRGMGTALARHGIC
jgi:hypothetical protein